MKLPRVVRGGFGGDSPSEERAATSNSASPCADRPLDTLFVSPRLHPRQDYCTKNEVSNVACLPPAEQVIVIGHSPGVVPVPTIQAQLTMPSWLAVFASSPLARLGPDL